MPQPHSDKKDSELIDLYWNTRDNRYLGILLERYTLPLFGVCMKYLKEEESAKDAVQQVFLKALTELEKYRVEYVKSWLHTVARNHCLMQLRDREAPFVEITDRMNPSDREDEDMRLLKEVREQTLDLMEEALGELSQEQQSCVRLFYLEKKSYLEVSGETGYPLNAVKSHIQNGKRRLRIILQNRIDGHG
jgi:RNA polymerase sigma-70 factor (ECF subfamily)